jgi:nucleotide-binding universal stress UspA family protein
MRPRTSPAGERSTPGPEHVFEHVLVGIDSTDESLVAAAQARVLLSPGGELVLLAAVERHLAAHAGLLARYADGDLAASASTELARAQELVDANEALLASGSLVRLLRAECATRDATLIAVGVRPHRRLAALTFGGHEVEALRDASCSVLVARPGWGPSSPNRVVVGIDGSPESRTAEAVARALATRLGCEVVPTVGLQEEIDLPLLREEREDALVHPGSLVEAVVSTCSARGLVVVGRARGRDGRRRSGLADRLVHAARCSVLVVEHADDDAGTEAASDG